MDRVALWLNAGGGGRRTRATADLPTASPPLAGMADPAIEASAPPPAEPAFDLAEHMQIRPIRWVPFGERYTAEPHTPENEDYDPFTEFDDAR